MTVTPLTPRLSLKRGMFVFEDCATVVVQGFTEYDGRQYAAVGDARPPSWHWLQEGPADAVHEPAQHFVGVRPALNLRGVPPRRQVQASKGICDGI